MMCADMRPLRQIVGQLVFGQPDPQESPLIAFRYLMLMGGSLRSARTGD